MAEEHCTDLFDSHYAIGSAARNINTLTLAQWLSLKMGGAFGVKKQKPTVKYQKPAFYHLASRGQPKALERTSLQ